MQRFFYAPHCCTPMFTETIEGAKFSQGAQFVLCERHTPFQIVEGFKRFMLPLANELFSVLLAQSVYDTKS